MASALRHFCRSANCHCLFRAAVPSAESSRPRLLRIDRPLGLPPLRVGSQRSGWSMDIARPAPVINHMSGQLGAAETPHRQAVQRARAE